MLQHFGTKSLKGFGVENLKNGTIAAGVILHYLKETHHEKIAHISKISRIEEDNYVWLDKFTIRNLELISSPNENAITLLNIFDNTVSPMGSRLIRRWITLPLKNRKPVEDRFEIVDYFINNFDKTDILRKNIKSTGDLERLISKVAIGKIGPREVLKIKEALSAVKLIKSDYLNADNDSVKKLAETLNELPLIHSQIEKTINPEPPALVIKGNVIAQGVSKELDDLRQLAFSGKDYLVKIQQREIQNTGITSLKIGYNVRS